MGSKAFKELTNVEFYLLIYSSNYVINYINRNKFNTKPRYLDICIEKFSFAS
jgi:hypothetical protein